MSLSRTFLKSRRLAAPGASLRSRIALKVQHFGSDGGKTRSKKLTADPRRASARKAARGRWAKRRR